MVTIFGAIKDSLIYLKDKMPEVTGKVKHSTKKGIKAAKVAKKKK